MSKIIQNLIPPPMRRKGRSPHTFHSILARLLIICILLGLMMILVPYRDYVEHKTEVNQELSSFKELVAVYQEGAAAPTVQPNITQPTHPETEPTDTLPELPTEPSTPPTESAPEESVSQQYLDELWKAMCAYNQKLVDTEQSELKNSWSVKATVLDLADFGLEDGVIGIVSIPDINVEMPLYLSATNTNLAKGFAQLSQTSMPTGGINTNCVIAGHRGYRGMPYMRDVELLDLGDSIFIQNYWEVMEYRISEILYIDPYRMDVLKIQPDKDILTIVTCHPYGVGSHRIILRCERYIPETPDKPESPDVPQKPNGMQTPAHPDEQESTQPQAAPTLPPINNGSWVWEWKETVTITSNQVGTFESSQLTIFLVEYLPWICLCFAVIVLSLTVVYSIISCVIRSIMQKKNKSQSDPQTESASEDDEKPVDPPES